MECRHHSRLWSWINAQWARGEAFEHTITVIQNSATGSPGVIFGDDLTIRTQSKNAANNGKDVDGIRTHGANTPDNPVFIITGDRTSIYVDGQMVMVLTPVTTPIIMGRVGKARPTFTSATICIFKPPVTRGAASRQTR